MNHLEDIVQNILNSVGPISFIAVDPKDFERLRAGCQDYCEENDEKFSMNPTLRVPNFLVMGVAIIPGGNA